MRVYASDPVIRHGSAPRRGRLRYDAAKVKPPMAGGQPLNKALGSMRKLIALLISMAAFPVMAADACQKQIPSELGAQIEKAYPQFRTPLVTDNLDEDVAYSKKATGNSCLGVASADFDGDGVADRVIGLTALTGPGALVVVALSHANSWQLHMLQEWPSGRSRLYVDSGPAGTYGTVLETVSDPGEVDQFNCPHSVAIFGATESTGVAYCYGAGKWQHTWFSD